MEIKKIKNYRTFAEELKTKTGCDVKIKILSDSNNHLANQPLREHYHYELRKDGFPLGILCCDDGYISFAPFATFENVTDSQYINVYYMPMFDEFINILKIFQEMFVEV